MVDVGMHLHQVLDRISEAARQCGRAPEEVTLMVVSKTQSRERIDEAIAAGQTVFGENRVQEAQGKYAGREPGIELHLIGHLQSNKAKLVPGLFSWVDSVDSYKLASGLSRRAADAGVELSLLLQYESSGETSKFGYRDRSLLLEDAARIADLPSVAVRGIMTIGPNTDDRDRVAAAFDETRALFEALRNQERNAMINVLSMGMSADFELAIRAGSTQIRVGSAIFGPRQ